MSGSGGAWVRSLRVYRATLANLHLEDVTPALRDGVVSWNADRAIKLTMIASFLPSVGLERYVDYLAPVVTMTRDDGTRLEAQLGLFAVTMPEQTANPARYVTYRCEDPTSLLRDDVFDDAYTVPGGTKRTTAAKQIALDVGIPPDRVIVPDLPSALPADMPITYPVGKNKLEAANELLEAAGCLHYFAVRDGRLMSQQTRNLEEVEPFARYTLDDLHGELSATPNMARFGNVVTVIKDNPADGEPLWAVRINDDPASPWSTLRIGRRAREPMHNPDLPNQAAVDALADQLFQEAGSYYRVVRTSALLNPTVDVHATVDLEADVAGECFCGRYWLRAWEVPLDTDSALMSLEMNRVVEFAHDEVAP